MPTPTMSDEELDALFRRGAEAYPNDMPAAAWASMETTLDEEARTQRLRRKVKRYFAGELLLITVIIWQIVRLAMPASTQPAAHPLPTARQAAVSSFADVALATTEPTASRSRKTAAQDKSAPYSFNIKVEETAPVRTVQPEQPAASSTQSAGQPANALAATGSHRGSVAPTRRDHKAVATGTAAASRATKQPLLNNESTTHTRPAAYLGSTSGTVRRAMQNQAARQANTRQIRRASAANLGKRLGRENIYYNKKSVLGQSITASQATEIARGESVDLLDGRIALLPVAQYPLLGALRPLAALPAPADSARQPRRPAPRPPYRVVVGLLAGPSFSGVRTVQSAQVGADYGLTLEYLFSTRLRLRVGLLSSQKNYQAASTDYVAPATWQWQPGTYNLAASCRITEIPLDLRYDVRRRPTYAVFTSLGINSLLMRNERYSYDWVASGRTFTKSAEVVKGSTHFLSVLNLAVGFEKSLGQRWSAQVEPFWQFPLGGVGAGQVRLTSAGAAFSLKYGLLR